MEKDIRKILDKLPATKTMITDLQNIDNTVKELMEYVRCVVEENTSLKKEYLILHEKMEKLIMERNNAYTTASVIDIDVSNYNLKG